MLAQTVFLLVSYLFLLKSKKRPLPVESGHRLSMKK